MGELRISVFLDIALSRSLLFKSSGYRGQRQAPPLREESV